MDQKVAQNIAQVPPPTSPPTNVESGGKAGEGCRAVRVPLTALAPLGKSTTGSTVVWGLTDAEYPTLWFHIPYQLTANQPGEFQLQDEQGKQIYAKPVTVVDVSTGVVGLQLSKSLQVNKNYLWTFTVRCDREDPSKDLFVRGWIQRTKLSANLAAQLKKAKPRDRAKLYIKENIQFEALTVLGDLRRSNPSDAEIAADWRALLTSLGFEQVAAKPVVEIRPLKE
ncbi:MAG: DUF928 domain-containing protein [Stenomitos rutilans HA7619-LM2]|nr:DUF928 domain-containing protein [Stenomitos rutilans HA7619-LM2]